MPELQPGSKLELLTRHQSQRRFAPKTTICEILQVPAETPHKIKARIFGHGYDIGRGATHWLFLVSDTIWLEHIGIPTQSDGTTNLPHVHEVVGHLTDEEFAKRRTKLSSRK